MSSAPAPADPDAAAYLRLVGIAALIGAPAAVAAALFLAFVHEVEHWLWDDLPEALDYASPPWFLSLGLPVAGAALVLLARRLLPGDGGHPPLQGLSTVPTPLAHAPGVIVAAVGTLGFGAVLGPEGPVIALGSAVAMAALYVVRLGPQEAAVLSSAGSFSAMSALFGGPLVAGILLVEGGLSMGKKLPPLLVPGLVAAAIGYVVFIGFGDWGGLGTAGLTVPDLPPYDGTHLYDLVIAVVVGVLAAIVVAAARVVAHRVDSMEGRLGWPALLLAGGLAVGVLAVLGDALGADSQDVLFSGQASVPAVVAEGSTSIVVVLLVTKFAAYGVSLGCGFRGGPIFPAIFLGVALASLTVVWFDVSPTLAIAVGAAAGMAAQARLLIAPVLFASLLVGREGLDTAPAAVLAAAAAWLTITALERRATARQEAAAPTEAPA